MASSEPPACTTLCLWEPDAALMIRKAQGQERARRSEYAAAARKGEAAEAAAESGVSAEIRAFEEFFAVELRAARDTMEQVMALEASDAETPKLFDWWHEQLVELHNLVAGATSYLPTQLRQQFGKSIADHEAKLKAERERLAPRKKFGFKNRSKVGKAAAAAPPKAAAPGGEEAPAASASAAVEAPTPKADTFQAPSGCAGFRDQAGTSLGNHGTSWGTGTAAPRSAVSRSRIVSAFCSSKVARRSARVSSVRMTNSFW